MPATYIRPYEDITEFAYSVDVAICGFGGAGASAAWEARAAGVSVLVLERASGGGGSTAMSSCEMYLGGSGGTKLQKDLGIEDSTENMIDYLSACLGPHGDAEKIRVYAEGAAEHFDWVEALGVPYRRAAMLERLVVPQTDESLLYTGNERSHPFTELAEPVPRGHVPSHEGDEGGRIFMDILMRKVDEAGARIVTDSRVLGLLRDVQGRVRGVMARIDGEEVAIEAYRGVILSMGGFAMNDEMARKYMPGIRAFGAPYGNPWDVGDGILLGMAAGGNVINMSEAFISLSFYPPAALTYGIFVNAQGQRFFNEDSYLARSAHFASLQEGYKAYLLVQNEDHGPSEYYNNMKMVATGETIAEVEREAGMPEGALVSTVELYNRHAANGEDPLFHKATNWVKPLDKPPFALVDYTLTDLDTLYGSEPGALIFSLGGLETRIDGAVLTPDGQAIPGLYAAGRTSAGLPRTSQGYASGMSVGDATFFGRRTGRAAAQAEIIA